MENQNTTGNIWTPGGYEDHMPDCDSLIKEEENEDFMVNVENNNASVFSTLKMSEKQNGSTSSDQHPNRHDSKTGSGIFYAWDPVYECHRPCQFNLGKRHLKCTKCKKMFSLVRKSHSEYSWPHLEYAYCDACPKPDCKLMQRMGRVDTTNRLGQTVFTKSIMKCDVITVGKAKANVNIRPDSIESVDLKMEENLENPETSEQLVEQQIKLKDMKKGKKRKDSHLVHRPKGHQCSECGKYYFTVKYLRRHEEAHLSKQLNICEVCGKCLNGSDQLDGHKQTCTLGKKGLDKVCGEEFQDPLRDKLHMKIHSVRVQKIPCTTCGKMFYSQFQLSHHNKSVHEPKVLPCHKCGKKCSSAKRLKKHEDSHLSKQLTCEVCGKSNFVMLCALKYHMEKHTEREKNCPCNTCGKMFYSKRDVYKHTRHVHGPKRFQCSICGVNLKSISSLKKHEDSHLGKRLHSCDVCGKTFRDSINQKKHMQIHTGEKKGQCAICGKQFRDRSYERLHMKIHTGEKRFECNKCGEQFLWAYTLKTHIGKCCGPQVPHDKGTQEGVE